MNSRIIGNLFRLFRVIPGICNNIVKRWQVLFSLARLCTYRLEAISFTAEAIQYIQTDRQTYEQTHTQMHAHTHTYRGNI